MTRESDKVSIAMIAALSLIAIVALLVAVVVVNDPNEKSGGIAVASACVGALTVLAGKLFKDT